VHAVFRPSGDLLKIVHAVFRPSGFNYEYS
jgi:hypothetical protein